MKYRMSLASLTASSYGDEFNPASQAPPTVLAKNLPRAADIQAELNKYIPEWRSTDGVLSDKAMEEAVSAVGTRLTQKLGAPFELVSNQGYYVPVVDKDGNIIGHDSASWVKYGGSYLFAETSTSPKIGMWGCILLGVIPE